LVQLSCELGLRICTATRLVGSGWLVRVVNLTLMMIKLDQIQTWLLHDCGEALSHDEYQCTNSPQAHAARVGGSETEYFSMYPRIALRACQFSIPSVTGAQQCESSVFVCVLKAHIAHIGYPKPSKMSPSAALRQQIHPPLHWASTPCVAACLARKTG
jgi:hypothetical protein